MMISSEWFCRPRSFVGVFSCLCENVFTRLWMWRICWMIWRPGGPGLYHKEQHAGWCIKYSKPDLILRLFSLLHPELWTLCSAPCWNCLMLKFNSCSPVTFASFHVSCRVTSDRTVLLRPAAVCHKCSFGTDDLRWSCFQDCSRHTLSVMTE